MVRIDNETAVMLMEGITRRGERREDELAQWEVSLIRSIEAQINSADPTAEGTLLERMINVLQYSMARNVLAGGVLKALRKAAFIPTEMRQVAAELEHFRLKCGNCGRKLSTGEAATVAHGDSDSPVLLTCTRCKAPTYMACANSNCDKPVEIPSAARKVFQNPKYLCEEHAGGKATPVSGDLTLNEMPSITLDEMANMPVTAAHPRFRTVISSTPRGADQLWQAMNATAARPDPMIAWTPARLEEDFDDDSSL